MSISDAVKVDLRCEHNTRWTTSHTKRTKDTSCPATMYLVLKKPYTPVNSEGRKTRLDWLHNRDCRSPFKTVWDFSIHWGLFNNESLHVFRCSDEHIKEGYLFKVTLKQEHNHNLDCAEALMYRPVSDETINKLTSMFQDGQSPSAALTNIKYDLQEEHGENYFYIAADRSVIPDIDFCHKWDVFVIRS